MVELPAVLERGRSLGFLGPGPVEDHIAHARRFIDAWGAAMGPQAPTCFLDLGSGGGLPGLVLAREWPSTSAVLLDASARRCAFLSEAAGDLGLGTVEVVCGRAEEVARVVEHQGRYELVAARAFGAPAATAECATRFLAAGGALEVSEPPDGADRPGRWPADGLAGLGLGPATLVAGANVVVIKRVGECPRRFPRRNGVPEKRPLF